ncbi:hypothetical protein HZH68_004230 [Vespula germanica]|uniref:Uncharacterized protein n=1 Tax=Vespula germanica TaxID=30212 RepID=A0A834NJ77_VESGE|nr:hypothetical protein HZH68_004230 [Vespula germanica]
MKYSVSGITRASISLPDWLTKTITLEKAICSELYYTLGYTSERQLRQILWPVSQRLLGTERSMSFVRRPGIEFRRKKVVEGGDGGDGGGGSGGGGKVGGRVGGGEIFESRHYSVKEERLIQPVTETVITTVSSSSAAAAAVVLVTV